MIHLSKQIDDQKIHFEYNKLLNQVNERSEPVIDIGVISSTINNMYKYIPKQDCQEYMNMIGSLVIHHNHLENGTLISNPFNATIMTKGIGILHVMTNFKPILQQIIGQYIENNAE